jgi:class 3 adenylate cyclase/tetratricopeptide (TPR) repeat protein
MDLAEWLKGLGLEQYAATFAENDIDFDLLGQLTDEDLKGLGVASWGNRKRLLAAIAERNAKPPPAMPMPGERRQVTILFADLCGFTALSQSLDPEEVHELVGNYTSLVDNIVLEYGGTVDKHIGDAVMALFGAPEAHDDDPLRAARSALDIHEALDRLSEAKTRKLEAHIGIASGEVVAGQLKRANAHDYTVLGDSVNMAARLVAAAGPGQTLLSDPVYQALSGRGICDALGEISLKGFDTPTRVWRLRNLSPEPAPASRSAFVGRKAELAEFSNLISGCVTRRGGQVIYVRGEAGIGKTRLVEEMRRFAEQLGFAVHRGLVLDFGVGKGQNPIRLLLLRLLGLSASSEQVERRNVAARLVADGVVPADRHMFLNDLLELPQTSEWRLLYDAMDYAARERGKRELAAVLVRSSCNNQASLLIIEDLHWADSQVLTQLATIAGAIDDIPVVMVMTSRLEGDQLDAEWRKSCRNTPFATIDLGPLREEDALSLAAAFIDATHSLALACIERAGGNPLFLEQLLRNAQEGSQQAVPASIKSLVLARMDRLAARDREAFQVAAIIGQRFELALLRRLTGLPNYTCENLIRSALVLTEGNDFLFAHALIQEGAYSSMLRSRRRALHVSAAEWFADRDQTLYAQHLDRADDERAADAYLKAAIAQRATYRLEAALRLANRGVEIARDANGRHTLICLKGEVQRDLGEIPLSVASFRSALTEAPDDRALCQAQIGLAEGLRVSEGFEEALRLLDEAQRTAEHHRMMTELARIHHLRGNIYFLLGNAEGCTDQHDRSFSYAKRLKSPEAEARALGGLGDAAYVQGKMRSAFEHFSHCVALSREHGFGRIEVANRSMVGFSRVFLNEALQARADGDAAARAASLVGQPRAEMMGKQMGVFASYELGDFGSMEAYLDQVMRLAQQLGARRLEAQGLEFKARALLDQGHRAEAAATLRDSWAICKEAGMQFCGPKVASALARAVNDPCQRAALLAEGQELLNRGSVGHNHLYFYRDAIEAFLTAGDGATALIYVNALEHYTRAEPLPWADLVAARGRILAKALQGVDDGVHRELMHIRGLLESVGARPLLPA